MSGGICYLCNLPSLACECGAPSTSPRAEYAVTEFSIARPPKWKRVVCWPLYAFRIFRLFKGSPWRRRLRIALEDAGRIVQRRP